MLDLVLELIFYVVFGFLFQVLSAIYSAGLIKRIIEVMHQSLRIHLILVA